MCLRTVLYEGMSIGSGSCLMRLAKINVCFNSPLPGGADKSGPIIEKRKRAQLLYGHVSRNEVYFGR